jgi:hypothetical protein
MLGTNKRISTPPTTVVTRWAISSAVRGQAEIERQIHLIFGTHADVAGEGRLIVAVGDATFVSTGSGERSVPPTALRRGWSLLTDKVLIRWTLENNTTQGCSECHEITSVCHRLKVVDGVRWVRIAMSEGATHLSVWSRNILALLSRVYIGLREWEGRSRGSMTVTGIPA